MDKKERNEEIQSRREFFKNAAKGALPILGAVLLAQVPAVAKATEIPMGCSSGCYKTCSNTCEGTCAGGCRDRCSGCGTACSKGCSSSCTGGCKGSCMNY